MEPVLSVRGIAKTFQGEGESCPALTGVTFDVAPHEIVCIMGPSGCGKSTLLRIILGLEHADTGSILGVSESGGGGASIAMVFQDHALFPWLSVRDNIVYGLRLAAQEVPEGEVQNRVTDLLSLTHLGSFAQSPPHQLSGGMKQRAAVARALAVKPSILLMDEPFSALDTFTRRELEDEILRIRQDLATTILMVTHNPEEAVYVADRILILSERPGVVSEIVSVTLPHPRSPADPEFIRIREQVTRMVQGKPDQDR
ncbi:MAG: ABC transporter ATP-binding protein [Methanomicrobiales archaeon]|jgi:ABC-type nitrate/sulfonate/bicarbonate transport system ATPase subunit|nr:ABC transporter ATP-binding protein [Methanomicrobiales archaeon]